MKETQTGIRTLWTINSLLDGKKKTQNEIVKYLNKLDQELKIKNIDLIKTNKATESPIIQALSKKKIIEKELVDVEGTNLKANYCTIPNDLETFLNILNEIEENDVQKQRKKFFINNLINSKIGQKQINKELVTKLLKKENITHVKLNDLEKNLIKTILIYSPQSLEYTVQSIQKNQQEWKINDAKDYFLFKLQTLFNLDLLEQYLLNNQNQTKSDNKIEIETKISLNPHLKADEQLSTQITNENMNFLFIKDILKQEIIYQ